MLRVTVVSVSTMFKRLPNKLVKGGCQRFRLSKVERVAVEAPFQETPQMGMYNGLQINSSFVKFEKISINVG